MGREEVGAAACDLVEAGRAEARAVGAQMRAIHRLWVAAQAGRAAARLEAMAQREAARAAGGRVCPDPLGPLAGPEHDLVTDVAAEVGPALHLPTGTARRRVQDAVILTADLPHVLTALEAGNIGWPQASVLLEQWRELIVEAPTWTRADQVPPPVEAVLDLVGELLERAPSATAAQLRAAARTRRVVLVADAAERTRRGARKHRGVWVEAAEDGMAYLHALLEAPAAVAAHARVDELANRLAQDVPTPGHPGLGCLPRPDHPEDTEARSVGELRADVLADLLLDGILPQEPGFPRGVRAQVSVLVPITVLTGAGTCGAPGGATGDRLGAGTGTAPTGAAPALSAEESGAAITAAPGAPAAVLSGYGPISPEVARQLAAGAGAWHRILTHPHTGVVLDHDRTVYTVPADLRRLVILRDGTCRFPGCRRRAETCEMDHTNPWAQGGPTAEHNLTALCRAHHRIKHRTGTLGTWTVRRIPTQPPNGSPPASPAHPADTPPRTPDDTAGRAPATPDDAPGRPPGTPEDAPGRAPGAPDEHTAVLEWTSPGGILHRTVPEHALSRTPFGDHHSGDCRTSPIEYLAHQPLPIDPVSDPPPRDPTDDPPPF